MKTVIANSYGLALFHKNFALPVYTQLNEFRRCSQTTERQG
ncbi:hypothetical protein [Acinetobacter sp.]